MAKPRKVKEPASSYGANSTAPAVKGAVDKKPEAIDPRQADDKAFWKAADKVFKTHAELFRKLAR